MKIWIDDIRPAPDDWVWVKNSDEALDLIASITDLTTVEEISFDHDLGTDEKGNDDTSRVVAYKICERAYEDGSFPKKIWIHSANPVGVRYLKGMFDQYYEGGATARPYVPPVS